MLALALVSSSAPQHTERYQQETQHKLSPASDPAPILQLYISPIVSLLSCWQPFVTAATAEPLRALSFCLQMLPKLNMVTATAQGFEPNISIQPGELRSRSRKLLSEDPTMYEQPNGSQVSLLPCGVP